jgi:ABC-type polysaccharide/polyol phosphate export permease
MQAYFRAIWHCRYFWLSLVKMDLRSRYRGSILGIGWSLIHPAAMTAILCGVFHTLFRQPLESYAPSVFAGLTFWNFWQGSSAGGCNCFFQGEAYIRQFPAPMAIYPLRTVLGFAFHFLVGMVLVLALTTFLKGTPPGWALLSLIPAMLVLLLLGWSAALLFGLATVRFRDTRHLTEVGMQGLFYLTPIMYTPEMLKGRDHLLALLQLNPLLPFLQLLRDPIVNGHPASLATYATAGLILALLGGAACLAMVHEERRLIFYL